MGTRRELDRPPAVHAVAGAVSRRSVLRGMAVGAAALSGACADDANTPASGAVDAGLADTGVDAIDGAPTADATSTDVAADAAVAPDDAAVDGADDAAIVEAPVAEDAGVVADVPADAARPGILSVAPDDPDVATRTLTYQSDTVVTAYLATPSRLGSFAGLVLIPDERGLSEHIKDVARRFAKSGCVALVPDLASRAGGTAALGGAVSSYLAGAKTDDLLRDLNAAVDALAAQSVVGANRYGTCGLGFGGDLALRFSATNPRLRAAVVYYAVTPSPPEIMKATSAAILGQYGATDAPTDATIPALERVMM